MQATELSSHEPVYRDISGEGDEFCQMHKMNQSSLLKYCTDNLNNFAAQCGELVFMQDNCREKIAELQQSLEELQLSRENLSQQYDAEKSQPSLLATKLKNCQDLLNSTEKERLEVLQELEDIRTRTLTEQKNMKDLMGRTKDQVTAAEEVIRLYSEHLGLHIRRGEVPNRTVFAFSQVNAYAPEKTYEVTVTLDGNIYYLSSSPALPNIEQIQQTLNQTDNFTAFLVHVRNLFKQMK